MKRLLIAAAFALSLGGCAGGTLPNLSVNPITVLTTDVQNPIGRKEYVAILRTYTVVLRPAVTYLELPTCKAGQSFVRDGCGDYARKVQVQNGIIAARKWRLELRRFYKANDRVNAIAAYNELVRALDLIKSNKEN